MLGVVEPSADDLILFTEIIDAGGFRAASAVTGIDKSMLSRRMQHLERLLGIALILAGVLVINLYSKAVV